MITILGKSSGAISMIAENMEKSLVNEIHIINNLGIPDDNFPYKNPRFLWHEHSALENTHHNFMIGVSNPEIKKKIFHLFKIESERFINCIHKSAQISSTVSLGQGIIINPLAVISAHAIISNFVLINRNVSIGHYSTVGDFTTIAPSATICGDVKIGAETFIGAGAIIRDGISVGNNCVIGAGSVVVKDVPNVATGYGNPFKIRL